MSDTSPALVVSFSEANRIIREHARSLARNSSRQTVPLLKSAGRILAEPIFADRDHPPFDRSARDGFACRAEDLSDGSELTVIGEVRAGAHWRSSNPDGAAPEISPGEAVEIMTGAPVPPGADCVVMVEHVERESGEDSSSIRLIPGQSTMPGANIAPRGTEARSGGLLLPAGARMAAAQIGVAASSGVAEVSVFARPRVAIVATGDELVELDRNPLPFEIRNSNSYSLAAQVLSAGGEPLRLGIARDHSQDLETLISSGREADLLLLSGGVSKGKYDLVEEVLLSMGAEFFFTGALIQPGKPVVFGRFQDLSPQGRPKYFFGLPGNPVSTMVTFLLFVEPLLASLAGQTWRGPRMAQARLKNGFRGKGGLTRFLPAILSTDCAQAAFDPVVELVSWQGSSDMAGASFANCFLTVPAERSSLDQGEAVTVLL